DSLGLLPDLMNQPELVDAFCFRAAVPHCALHDGIRCNPAKSCAKGMSQVVDREVGNTCSLESCLPGPVIRKNSVEPGIHLCNNVAKPYRIFVILKVDGVFGSHNSQSAARLGWAGDSRRMR